MKLGVAQAISITGSLRGISSPPPSVEELNVDGPGEPATRGTYWDVELSLGAEKYWITPDDLAPLWFNSAM